MVLHNFKQIVRSLWRFKSFTSINVLGLCIGTAAVVLIALIADFEKSFDRFHTDGADIYRIVDAEKRASDVEYSAAVPYPLGKALRSELPGIAATQTHFVEEMNIRVGKGTPLNEENVLFADSLFFRIMDFGRIEKFWVAGNPATALMAPRTVVLTESTAKKYFGSGNPMGQLVRLDNRLDAEVTGIIKDLPATTHLPFGMVVSYSSLTRDFNAGLGFDQWGVVSSGYCYVRLPNEAAKGSVQAALTRIVQEQKTAKEDFSRNFSLQPLSAIHFDTKYELSNPSYTVSNKYLTVLMLLAGFILLIACVNYVNLSTSLAFAKSKEVGIRKTIGASKAQLFFHYMQETFLVTLAATLLGCLLAILLLPSVNTLMDKAVSARQLWQPEFVVGIIGGIVFISFLSGAYPALILAGFRPVFALKSAMVTPGKTSLLLRKGLVVFQFTTSIALIVCTIVIAKQVAFFQKKELGFSKEAVVEVELPENDSLKMQTFSSLLQNQSGIQNFSFCLGAPISGNDFGTSYKLPESTEKATDNVQLIPCDSSYLQTYGLKLIAGRWFLPGESKQKGAALVANQTLVKSLGYSNVADAVGKQIEIGVNHYKPTIIGVVQDFHVSSLHQTIAPVALMPYRFFYYAAAVRIQPSNPANTLAGIETAFRKTYPDALYSMKFIDETLAERYEQERRDFTLFKVFSVVSIFICCIGLWGLIAFLVVRKTKEIGIRKVLGASVKGIVLLLSKDFVKLIAIALLVASPIAWWVMRAWLNDFAYRITIGWWVFLAAGAATLLIALLTISFQAIKAAIASPIKNLRTE